MKSQLGFIINIYFHWLKGTDIRTNGISKPSSGNDFQQQKWRWMKDPWTEILVHQVLFKDVSFAIKHQYCSEHKSPYEHDETLRHHYSPTQNPPSTVRIAKKLKLNKVMMTEDPVVQKSLNHTKARVSHPQFSTTTNYPEHDCIEIHPGISCSFPRAEDAQIMLWSPL